MALAIANPACCCALTGNSQNGSDSSRTCCVSTQSSENDSKKQEKSCSCAFAKEKSALEHEAILPDLKPAQQLPPILANGDSRDLLPKLSQATTFLKKWPPGSLPVPTHAARLAAMCSYLI